MTAPTDNAVVSHKSRVTRLHSVGYKADGDRVEVGDELCEGQLRPAVRTHERRGARQYVTNLYSFLAKL